MKSIISRIGAVFGYVLLAMLFIVLLPFTLVLIVAMVALGLYEKLWQKIRQDPVRKVTIEGIFDPDWTEVSSKEGYVEAYKRVSGVIARLSSANESEIKYEGFEIFDNHDTNLEWNDLMMSHTLTSGHANIRLSLEFGAKIEGDGFYVSEEAYDERNSFDGFPNLIGEIVEPKSISGEKLMLRTYDDIWVMIAILRGDVKRTERQLWVRVPEYEIWMVEYKVDGSDYGYRSHFANGVARKYWFDKKYSK